MFGKLSRTLRGKYSYLQYLLYINLICLLIIQFKEIKKISLLIAWFYDKSSALGPKAWFPLVTDFQPLNT